MLKKEQFIEQLQRRLCGGEPTDELYSRFHPMIIEKEVDSVYESVLQSVFNQNIKGGNYAVLDAYTRNFSGVLIEFDPIQNIYYSTLPKPVVVLNSPTNGTGNYGIRFIKAEAPKITDVNTKGAGGGVYFVPIDNNADVVFNELEVNKISLDPTYYVEGMRIPYNFHGYDFKEGDTVTMSIVPTFSFLADDDYITMPEIMTKNGMLTVADEVYRRMIGMPPEKLDNSNNPTP